MRKFKKTASSRQYKLTASARKSMTGKVTGNRVIDPEPIEGPFIWGSSEIIDTTPGAFEDYPDE